MDEPWLPDSIARHTDSTWSVSDALPIPAPFEPATTEETTQ